jgi:hypothetical protein
MIIFVFLIVIVFGIGSHGVGWYPLLLCNGNSIYYYYSSFFLPSKVCPTHFSEMPWSNCMKPCCRCHGNGQNAKQMKNTKMYYSVHKNIIVATYIYERIVSMATAAKFVQRFRFFLSTFFYQEYIKNIN